MADHMFKVGQIVSVGRPFPDRSGGMCEILRVLPESVDGDLFYRVRGADNRERAVRESDLTAAVPGVLPPPVDTQPSRGRSRP